MATTSHKMVSAMVVDADTVRIGGSAFVRERTCRMVRVEKEERILYGWLECSNCGPVYPPAAIEIQDAVRHCPFCGAKVTKGKEARDD